MRRLSLILRTTIVLLGLFMLTPGMSLSERKKPFIDSHLTRMMRGTYNAAAHGGRPGEVVKDELKRYARFLAMKTDTAQPEVRVRLKLDAGARQSMERLGIKTYGRMPGFASAVIPIHRLKEVAALAGLEAMQAMRIPEMELDVSRVEVRSTELSNAYPARGAGVILGSVDSGIDWRHQDFRKPDGTTRIKYIWSQDDDCVGVPPAPPFDFGCLYTEAQINAALLGGPAITAPDAEGHGTNTIGVAAGNGRGTGLGWPAERYVGMAPEADIIAVKFFPEPGDLTDCMTCFDLSAAIDFIDTKATELGQPYVINLSLGSQYGGHDGTDLDEQTIDALTGAGIPGRVIVKSAGNERGHAIHIRGSVLAGQTNTHNFTIPNYGAQVPGTFNDAVAWSLWYNGGDSLTVTIADPTTSPCGASVLTLSSSTGGGSVGLNSTSGGMVIDDTASPAPNGARFFEMEVDDQFNNPNTPPCRGVWQLRVRGDTITVNGVYDAWIWFSSFGTLGQEAVWAAPDADDNTRLISVPGTSFDVTTVGAYVTRASWRSTDGLDWSYGPVVLGSLASFSSPGPARDGRLKPEINAPGWTSLSSLSADAAPLVDPRTIAEDGVHWALIGTSFAAPHVAGIYAQLLSLNPNLDAIDLRTLLSRTGRQDANTGAVPNSNWGFGKVDAKAAGDLMVKPIPDVTATNNQTFVWTGIASASTYNAYRGDISLIGLNYYGSCLATGLATPTLVDFSVPVAGGGFFYHFTGVKDGIEGMLGFRSDGTVRPNTSPCP